ncbi:MAG: RluA family pseudouridine synthase [Spirochaetaceae bacterium]|nr:RluA family pseudouridine synthase [Spirochaetaceae bacterium]
MAEIFIEVKDLESSQRLDTYVSKNLEKFSRSRLKNGVEKILLNDKIAKLSAKVNNGDKIFIQWQDPIPEALIPENIPLEILYEDENVTVVNKKQGMVTHPACGNWSGTLVHALLYHWGMTESKLDEKAGNHRRGIVHRLDKDTSGIIICAKNFNSEEWLQNQFKERRVKKEYIAIVKGVPKEKSGSVKINMIRDSKNRKKFTTTDDSSKGKFSHTVYRCIATYGNYSLMKLKLKTGRTHQIRVHMKYLGCPILGDPIYGTKDSLFDSATLMLHSKTLGIRLPQNEDFTTFDSSVPIRFKKVMHKLHKMYQKIVWK